MLALVFLSVGFSKLFLQARPTLADLFEAGQRDMRDTVFSRIRIFVSYLVAVRPDDWRTISPMSLKFWGNIIMSNLENHPHDLGLFK
jgi:hypothetical protein